jgi:DNA-directed RNA polymerase specialized sigma subunit
VSLETIYCQDKFIDAQDPIYILEEKQIESEYNNVICMLPPRERDVYMSYRANEHTRKDLTDFYNISNKQLYQIVHTVNNKLSVAFPSFAEPVQIAC